MSCFSLTVSMMDLSDAVEAHIQTSLKLSAFGDKRQLVQIGPLKVVRDAPGRKRPPRLQSIIICETPPEEAIQSVRAYEPTHWILSVVDRMDADHDSIKNAYKSFGYRLNIRLPVFARELRGQLQAKNQIVQRVTDQSIVDAIARIKRRKYHPAVTWQGHDPLVRLYAAIDSGQVVGWVESIRATKKANWVADLFVIPSHRGRGIGTSLLQCMLREDSAHGVKNSALLSSSQGVNLYRNLGYEQIGWMQIFAPIKKRG